MTNDQFYAECAALLGVDHDGCPFPYRTRTRWNNRNPGQGRFSGAGIIRVFGSQVHVALNNPRIMGIYEGQDAALAAIKAAIDNT